jgi:ProP effector
MYTSYRTTAAQLLSPMNRPQRLAAEADVVIARLADAYPKCFATWEFRRRPLAIGIRAELQLALTGESDLRHALRRYTSNQVYLRRLRAGAPRIGLDGKPGGAVTEDEEAKAKARLAARAQRRREAAAAAKAAEQPVEPPSNLRASIASLREAGRKRRETA